MPTSKKAAKSTTKTAKRRPKTLRVSSRKGAKLTTIVKDLRLAFGEIGCLGCRSGIDRIIIADPVIRNIR